MKQITVAPGTRFVSLQKMSILGRRLICNHGKRSKLEGGVPVYPSELFWGVRGAVGCILLKNTSVASMPKKRRDSCGILSLRLRCATCLRFG